MSLASRLDFYKAMVAPYHAKLIVVSKTHSVERIQEVYECGHRVFGENKVQELVDKYEQLPKDIEWHMIGHLQKNKVKYIANFVSLIHSVDSLALLNEINKQGLKNNRVIPCLLQIYIADEETKYGFDVDELYGLIGNSDFLAMNHIKIIGLMGMATFTDDVQKVASEFKSLQTAFHTMKSMELPANIEMKELSMGMSGDCEIALEHGSTMIRIGTAIFGKR